MIKIINDSFSSSKLCFLFFSASRPQYPETSGINDNWPTKYRWWATGGQEMSGGVTTVSASTEIFKHDDWTSAEIQPCETNIQLPGAIGLSGQCVIQINSVETAVIGGKTANGTVNNFVRISL
jgi:hypothetical protein